MIPITLGVQRAAMQALSVLETVRKIVETYQDLSLNLLPQ
jgi:hypothetical protein